MLFNKIYKSRKPSIIPGKALPSYPQSLCSQPVLHCCVNKASRNSYPRFLLHCGVREDLENYWHPKEASYFSVFKAQWWIGRTLRKGWVVPRNDFPPVFISECHSFGTTLNMPRKCWVKFLPWYIEINYMNKYLSSNQWVERWMGWKLDLSLSTSWSWSTCYVDKSEISELYQFSEEGD